MSHSSVKLLSLLASWVSVHKKLPALYFLCAERVTTRGLVSPHRTYISPSSTSACFAPAIVPVDALTRSSRTYLSQPTQMQGRLLVYDRSWMRHRILRLSRLTIPSPVPSHSFGSINTVMVLTKGLLPMPTPTSLWTDPRIWRCLPVASNNHSSWSSTCIRSNLCHQPGDCRPTPLTQPDKITYAHMLINKPQDNNEAFILSKLGAQFEHYLGPCDDPCYTCGALHWRSERNKRDINKESTAYPTCCQMGSAIVPVAYDRAYPEEWKKRLLGSGDDSGHFRRYLPNYNNALSFTSLGARIDKSTQGHRGIYTFRTSGNLYHNMRSYIPNKKAVPVLPRYTSLAATTSLRLPIE
ncbi:hypothetical protein PCANC_17586 [Puccinia coronata f. sp. avenae]|uniref:Uncharacterized protein n=1 Tax=Puccinia coronata f. sp. avenae TaxID=200324 RepID=A0A2N5VN54_9BASI|nr:hypothetical protein PCANC_17586 [Puccinia coronata f. sp. avenae]